VTILAVASALVDDFVRSGSFLRNQVSACDMGVIDTSQAACSVMLRPGQSSFVDIGYGGVALDNWGIVAEGYIKVTGDLLDSVARVWHLHDAIIGAVRGGCLAGSNYPTHITQVTAARLGPAFELHGHTLMPVFVDISVREDP
jgi:hypothetical protein